ncbi:diguanylate cyclase [Nitrospirota bacterium]
MTMVYVYAKDKETLFFLRKFFTSNKKKYKASFFKSLPDMREKLSSSPPDVLIAGAPDCIDRIAEHIGSTPVMAILTSELPDGMRSVIDTGVEHYMIKPYQDYDLSCKLHILSRKKDYVDIITQEKKDLETLVELTDLLSSSLDPEEVLYLIVKKLSEIIPVSRCSILNVDAVPKGKAEVISTFEKRDFGSLELDLGNYPEIRKALRTRNTVIVNNADKDPLMRTVRDKISPLEIKSIMVIPVFFRSEVIGTLFLRTTRRSYSFTEREKKLCQNIANTAAKALNNAYLFQEISSQRSELEKLSITDYLTGIYNIRYLYHRLEVEYESAKRYSTPISCIMLDIDHFKKVNDTYGHRTGDIILREFAMLINGHTRKSDVFARYGGEEFIMLLPHSNLVGAISKAESLKDIVREHKFKGLRKKAKITISLGVSSFPYHKAINAQDDLIRLADDALLKAKNKGRDRVIVYE